MTVGYISLFTSPKDFTKMKNWKKRRSHNLILHMSVPHILAQIFLPQLTRPVNLQSALGFPLSRDFSDFQVPGLLDFFSPGATGPRDLQGL